jgi:hypothetical protein
MLSRRAITCCITADDQLEGGGRSKVRAPRAARVADNWWGVKEGSLDSEHE